MTVIPFPLVTTPPPPPVAPGHVDDAVLALLAPWRGAGVLDVADVHTAEALCRACGVGEEAPDLVVAAALAVRAPRLGHTCLDLATVQASAPAEVEGDVGDLEALALDELPWPDVPAWREALAASSLVSGPQAPLVLEGTRLYLERYHRYEVAVAAELRRRAEAAPVADHHDARRRRELLDVLLPGDDPRTAVQRRAAAEGARRLLSVIVGGPGTGKTHTVAALLALLLDEHGGELRVSLAAPTGKAAARLAEAFRARATELRGSSVPGADALAARLEDAAAQTLHRLLGARPGTTRFRHDAANPLVDDVVIVDETSMVALPLMARLLDALRPDARLVLVGDPGQLASVEAGSVLGDLAGPAVDAAVHGRTATGVLAESTTVLTRSFRFPSGSTIDRFATAVRAGDADGAEALLARASGPAQRVAPDSPPAEGAPALPAERPSTLTETPGGAAAGPEDDPDGPGPAPVQGVLAFDDPGSQVASEAPASWHPAAGRAPAPAGPAAAREGATDVGPPSAAPVPAEGTDLAVPEGPPEPEGPTEPADGVRLEWVPLPGDGIAARAAVEAVVRGNAAEVRRLAEFGEADAALGALGAVRVLCGHRRGRFGVTGWNHQVEQWLSEERPLAPGFYVGRPVMVTANDRTNGVFNGDLGVTVAGERGACVAFPAAERPRLLAPVRLESVDTAHALTIHKSQGSEFDHVVVVLPPAASRLATRELLYTAVTRARRTVTLVGPADAVRRAVEQRVHRASGLPERLWPDHADDT